MLWQQWALPRHIQNRTEQSQRVAACLPALWVDVPSRFLPARSILLQHNWVSPGLYRNTDSNQFIHKYIHTLTNLHTNTTNLPPFFLQPPYRHHTPPSSKLTHTHYIKRLSLMHGSLNDNTTIGGCIFPNHVPDDTCFISSLHFYYYSSIKSHKKSTQLPQKKIYPRQPKFPLRIVSCRDVRNMIYEASRRQAWTRRS